jgi:glutathione synthase/RimK-type ligase-like ATP-grasp enzyme
VTVLIIGKQDDLTSMLIQEKIRYRGVQTVMFDSHRFPYELQLSYNTETPAWGKLALYPNTPSIEFSEITAVFRRWSDGVNMPDWEEDPLRRRLVYANLESAIHNFYHAVDALWVNTPEATAEHRVKVHLLRKLKAAGVRIPETLITNDPNDYRTFYQQQNGQVIQKPVLGWASTTQVTEEHLSDDFLSTLSNMPVTLQELIPGVDIRLYMVLDEFFAMEIHSDTLDFRDDQQAERKAIQLPETVQKMCKTVMKTLGLVYAGLDLRRTPEGEYVFFEANPSPVFIYDEEVTNYPISDRLVDLLTSKEP